MQDGTDHVGQLEGVRGQQLCLVDCQVDEFLEGFDVAFALLFEQTVHQLLYISHL